MRNLLGVLLLTTSLPALSIQFATVPEPGAFSLFGIGAVAGVLIWARNRKKK